MTDGITESDANLAMQGPAPYVNHFYIGIIGPDILRITFTEHFPPASAKFRAAIVINKQDILNLVGSINNLLDLPQDKLPDVGG